MNTTYISNRVSPSITIFSLVKIKIACFSGECQSKLPISRWIYDKIYICQEELQQQLCGDQKEEMHFLYSVEQKYCWHAFSFIFRDRD